MCTQVSYLVLLIIPLESERNLTYTLRNTENCSENFNEEFPTGIHVAVKN